MYVGGAAAWLSDHGIHESKMPIQAIRETVDIIGICWPEKRWLQRTGVSVAEHVRAPYQLPDYQVPVLINRWGCKLCALAGEIAGKSKSAVSTNLRLIPVISIVHGTSRRNVLHSA